jgi:hypothetical protein
MCRGRRIRRGDVPCSPGAPPGAGPTGPARPSVEGAVPDRRSIVLLVRYPVGPDRPPRTREAATAPLRAANQMPAAIRAMPTAWWGRGASPSSRTARTVWPSTRSRRASRSPGWRPTPSTTRARSRWRCAARAKATSRRHRRAPRPLLGRAADCRGHGGRGRGGPAALRVAAPLGGRGHEGPAPARLGLAPTRPPRGGRVRRRRRGPLDARPADPAQPRRRRSRVLHDVVPGGHPDRGARRGRGPALGDRGRLRDRQEQARPRPQRSKALPSTAPGTAGTATSRSSCWPSPCSQSPATARTRPPSKPRPARVAGPALIRWSVQEIRRIAGRLAQRRVSPALIIGWSACRRAHQARARRAHLMRRPQL